jgi:hypothetical protein
MRESGAASAGALIARAGSARLGRTAQGGCRVGRTRSVLGRAVGERAGGGVAPKRRCLSRAKSYPRCRSSISFKFKFGLEKMRCTNDLSTRITTKRAVIDDQTGGQLRLSGRGIATYRAAPSIATKRAAVDICVAPRPGLMGGRETDQQDSERFCRSPRPCGPGQLRPNGRGLQVTGSERRFHGVSCDQTGGCSGFDDAT